MLSALLKRFKARSVEEVISRANAEAYCYSINWDTDIPASSNGQSNVPIDQGYWFIVQATAGDIWMNSATGGQLALTPVARSSALGAQTAVDTFNVFLNSFRVDLRTNNNAWFDKTVRACNIYGSSEHPSYWLANYVVAPGNTIFGTLFNDNAATFITARSQLTFRGVRIAN